MSTTPKPSALSILTAYQQYRENLLLVNRRYQRKLVWSTHEKAMLIDSILKGYPVPLILLAESRAESHLKYEIIDGIQRLNAIFDFIENKVSTMNGQYFDVTANPRAKELAEKGLFEPAKDNLLSRDECVRFVEYNLAVTIHGTHTQEEITDIFGRINSGGRQLSKQQQRQAGVINPFSEAVNEIAINIRGDVTLSDIIYLADMPTISIEQVRDKRRYGIDIDSIDWVNQGIMYSHHLRASLDEEIISDILATILLDRNFNGSSKNLNAIYNKDSESFRKLEAKMATIRKDLLIDNFGKVFSIFVAIFEKNSKYHNFKNVVRPNTSQNNLIKTEFYAVFVALYVLMIDEVKKPADYDGIADALFGLENKISGKSGERNKNIDLVNGLIRNYFVAQVDDGDIFKPELRNLIINHLTLSASEMAGYELKQGILNLDNKREINQKFLEKNFPEIICAIANVSPKHSGYIFFGVADDGEDATRIEKLDNIKRFSAGGRDVVGIDRECLILGIGLEDYLNKLFTVIRNSSLSQSLKTEITQKAKIVALYNFNVIILEIPPQKSISILNGKVYIRDGSSKREATPQEIITLSQKFPQN